MELTKEQLKALRKVYPYGTRVELISMGEDPAPIQPGTRGRVHNVDDIGTIHIDWDNGRQIGIVYGVDKIRRL